MGGNRGSSTVDFGEQDTYAACINEIVAKYDEGGKLRLLCL